jgi:signal transduction histidine kinase
MRRPALDSADRSRPSKVPRLARISKPPRRVSSKPPPSGARLPHLLAPLTSKAWLRSVELLREPPAPMFRAASEDERCVEVPTDDGRTFVHVTWEPDEEGLRAEFVDQVLESARARASEAAAHAAAARADAHVRRARRARIDLELELGAAHEIAAAATERALAAESRYEDAERRFVERERIAAVSAMFASVGHDIRSPLTSLVCNLRFLEERVTAKGLADDAEIRGVFGDTKLACDLIDGVLDGMRTYASASGTPRMVPMRHIVESTIRLFRWHMSQRGVRFDYVIEGEPEAWGTPSEICQIVLNLLANAADATPRGGTVRLRARRSDDTVAIRVSDEGPGISPADRERVFAPFHSTKGGLGIGLTVARTMARHHGGDLVVATPLIGERGAALELRLQTRAP